MPPVDALQQEEEEEEESEWETDTDEELPVHKMIKPVFVPKARAGVAGEPAAVSALTLRPSPQAERESLAQRDALAAAEEAEVRFAALRARVACLQR